MIWGIHYFTTKLKTEIDVIIRGCLNTPDPKYSLHFIKPLLYLIKTLLHCIKTSYKDHQDYTLAVTDLLGRPLNINSSKNRQVNLESGESYKIIALKLSNIW